MLDFDLAVHRRSQSLPGKKLRMVGGLARKNLWHPGL
jgi:hypothetical protein